MKRDIQHVPYGYEPPASERKGTLIFYDSFGHISDMDLLKAAETAIERKFVKLVLYPLHEETVRRMSKEKVEPLYKREDRLHEWKREQGRSFITVEGLEGKRKKYTPLDSAMRHISGIYPAPYFLYLTPDMANLFASYSSFEEWIVKLRLVLSEAPGQLHPRLEKFRHRWDIAGVARE
ncbi:hypothetical protein [Paenibacillus sp. MMS20-IR301]|uniref:hypothetical protein n=1 Tax=Paenibacillus sp. MMS20-IR301 TaxID=2895946 RepID=UPI0028E68CEE|nr:hypothetical protein [Paenibacillus sp. MMS20-IR301]WNS45487.1 hypothetical protein LOS79_09520 [Paenibacillus sp. MMS20-IR301]